MVVALVVDVGGSDALILALDAGRGNMFVLAVDADGSDMLVLAIEVGGGEATVVATLTMLLGVVVLIGEVSGWPGKRMLLSSRSV
jgi:hypothetical protein